MTHHIIEQFDDAVAVTPSDTNQITEGCRGLYIGTTGNLAVKTASGNVVTFTAVPAGTILKLGEIQRVMATNTTASTIVALY